MIKGYQIVKGEYVLLEDEEIEAVRIESRKTLELVQFVDACETDPLYFEKPYYVVPKDDLAEEGLPLSHLVGLPQGSQQQPLATGLEGHQPLPPTHRQLVQGDLLRLAQRLAQHDERLFSDIDDARPKKELLDLATKLIEQKSAPFDASEYEDRYIEALRKLIDQKAKSKSGKAIIEDAGEPASARGNVIDLMAALKKSVGKDKPGPRSTASRKKNA